MSTPLRKISVRVNGSDWDYFKNAYANYFSGANGRGPNAALRDMLAKAVKMLKRKEDTDD